MQESQIMMLRTTSVTSAWLRYLDEKVLWIDGKINRTEAILLNNVLLNDYDKVRSNCSSDHSERRNQRQQDRYLSQWLD